MTEREEVEYYLNRYGLNEVLTAEIKDQLKLIRYQPGQHIVRSGELLDRFYFFVEGKGKVYSLLENGKSLLVRFYNPLELVGEVELFSDRSSVCNLQAITEVVCLEISSKAMLEACRADAKLMEYFCRSLSDKLQNFNISSAINLTYPLENRLAGYLVSVTTVDNIYTDKLTELADLLGTSYRHLTRTIRDFIDEGIISRKGRSMEILDWNKLKELAREIYT